MIETILEIKEETFKDGYQEYDGYIIKTNKQEIKLGIENEQSCCESWGYFASNDDFDDFINAELLSIEQVDDALNKTKLKDNNMENDEDSVIFVNINTSKGTLQLAVYNSHNGYYGHSVIMRSNQLKLDTGL